MLAPQPQRDGGGVVQVLGLLPVADLGVVVGVAAGEQERVVVREPFERAPYVAQWRLAAGDVERDVPEPGADSFLGLGGGRRSDAGQSSPRWPPGVVLVLPWCLP